MHRIRNNSGAASGKYWDYQFLCESYCQEKEGVVNKTFVQMMEALGYDIELIYTKRDMEGGNHNGDVL